MSTPIISLQSVTKGFGPEPLFQGITFVISDEDRLALIGPNGSGKSTLLKIIAGEEDIDDGQVSMRRNLTRGYVPQVDRLPPRTSVEAYFISLLSNETEIERARKLSRGMALLGNLAKAEDFEKLSGGERKRISIAAALMLEPELLLLDEPTNHLDVFGIEWLEEILSEWQGAFVIVSHDRILIEKLASRVVEINQRYPKGFFESQGAYDVFLESRANFFEAQSAYQDSLRNKVRREVEWLRKTARAQRTKEKGRITQAESMIAELQAFKPESGRASMTFAESERFAKELIKLEGVDQKVGANRILFQNLSIILKPGDRCGIVGPNGVGKTTLLETIVGKRPALKGKVTLAHALSISYFDQVRTLKQRAQAGSDEKEKELTEEELQRTTLQRVLSPDGDGVVWNDRPVHVASWAKRFLFKADQLNRPFGALSGGERARALLARVMLERADVLILDEPTNDLDIQTLEVLEEALLEFNGVTLLVSHDRYLMQRLATKVIGFLPGGRAELFSDYFQWEKTWHEQAGDAPAHQAANAILHNGTEPAAGQKGPVGEKLSYPELKELGKMEGAIEKAEKSVGVIQDKLNAAAAENDTELMTELCEDMARAQEKVDELYARWESLLKRPH